MIFEYKLLIIQDCDIEKNKKKMIVLNWAVVSLQVKIVRETMNRALDMWKEVADASENVPSPIKSACASVGKVHCFFCLCTRELIFK